MADDEPPVTIVSSKSDKEIERDWALRSINWPTRELIANLFRVIRGAGRPYILMSQLFELTKVLADAHDHASAWEVSQEFERVVSSAMPDWEWGDETRGDLHTAIRGALQIVASTAVHQSTQQAAGRSELLDGINSVVRRREARRQKEEEEYRAYARSLRPSPKKRKATKRKVLPKVAALPALPPPPKEPEPEPRTTWEIMKENKRRLAEGKEPI